MATDTLSRPLNAAEGMWATVNDQSSPLAMVLTIRGPLSDTMLRQALAVTRAEQPYFRVCVDKDSASLKPSSLTEIPLTFETVSRADLTLEHLRALVRAQLLIGVPLSDGFVRVHVVRQGNDNDDSDQDTSYVILIANHTAFDGRSLLSWTAALMTAIESQAEGGTGEDIGASLPFLDWTTQLPKDLQLDPLDLPTPVTITPDATATDSTSDSVPMVEDIVWECPPALFTEFKERAKLEGCKLNAPLAVAFSAAFARVAGIDRKEQKDTKDTDDTTATSTKPAPQAIVQFCAVDVRGQLQPALPGHYCCSAAGSCNVPVFISPHEDMWKECSEYNKRLRHAIDSQEAFRLQYYLNKGEFAAIPTLFNISFIWSNIGHYSGPTSAAGITLERLESHVMGQGVSPIVSCHCTEVAGNLSISITYSPKFFSRALVESLRGELASEIERLASSDECTFQL